MTDATVALRPESKIAFHDIVIHREPGREPILGCPRARWYLEVDDDTLRAVEALQTEGRLDAASERLRRETGEEFDLREFVESLMHKGFVRAVDGVPIEASATAAEKHPWLHAVPVASLRGLRHPAFVLALCGVIAAWLVAIATDPSLRPSYSDVFFVDRPVLTLVVSFLGLLGLAYVHELAHFFVARSYGVEATISLSHRFYLLVLQTDVTNAWPLRPRQKIAIFLAGVALNLSFAAIAGGYLALGTWGIVPLSPLGDALLRLFVYLNLFPLVFQLFLPARTDLYHVLLVATGERNLLADALAFLRFRSIRFVKRLRGEPRAACAACTAGVFAEDPFCLRCGARRDVAEPNRWSFSPRARRFLLPAGIFFLVGTVLGYAFFLFVAARVLGLHAWTGGRMALAAADHGAWGVFAEAAFAVVLAAGQLAFAGYFIGRGLYGLLLAAPFGWVQRRYLPRLLRRVPPSAHDRIVRFAMGAFPQNVTYFERVPARFTLISARTARTSPGDTHEA